MKKEYKSCRTAVLAAKRSGLIKKPDRCSSCSKVTALLHTHHHRGYAKEHWLSVVWLCAPCHRKEHGRGKRTDHEAIETEMGYTTTVKAVTARALGRIAAKGDWSISKTIAILLRESPRLQAEIAKEDPRRNGRKSKAGPR